MTIYLNGPTVQERVNDLQKELQGATDWMEVKTVLRKLLPLLKEAL